MSAIPLTTSYEVIPVECDSAIERVVVYGRGALVTRRIKPISAAQLMEAGEAELWLPGITPQARPGSMTAKVVAGPGALVAVRTALHLPEHIGARSELGLEVRRLGQRIKRLEEERRLVLEQRERLLRLGAKPAESWRLRKLSAAARLERGLALTSISQTRLEGLDERVVRLDAELVELRRALAAAQLKQSQASGEAQAEQGRPSWRAMVHVREPGEGLVVEVTYMVPWACWWPVYALRLSDAGRRATLQVSALVVQDSDEDWRGVELGLSTADLALDAQLPTLPALKLGKVQPPKRHGYRPLPEGMERLFAAYDREMPAQAAPVAIDVMSSTITPDKRELADTYTRAGASYDAPSKTGELALGGLQAKLEAPAGAVMPMPVAAAPMPMMPQAMVAPAARKGGFSLPNLGIMDAVGDLLASEEVAADYDEGGFGAEDKKMMSRSAPARGGGGAPGAKPRPQQAAGPLEPEGGWLDFDQLRMAGPDEAGRGKLYKESRGAAGDDRHWRVESWQQEASRLGGRDPQQTRGLFDTRYDAAGRVEVPADGRLHKIDLMRADGAARLRWRAVPRERAEVYRMAYVVNPLDVPLLEGPIDVFVEGSFLATDALAKVDRGGEFVVGMGVDDRLRVARNAKMEEERIGMLGGKAQITQRVTIDVRSSLGFAAEVEVLDRVPVAGQDAVVVEALDASPSASAYTQQAEGRPVEGGRRWLLRLEPGGQSKITFGYKLTLSAKEEIVGGNRREP